MAGKALSVVRKDAGSLVEIGQASQNKLVCRSLGLTNLASEMHGVIDEITAAFRLGTERAVR